MFMRIHNFLNYFRIVFALFVLLCFSWDCRRKREYVMREELGALKGDIEAELGEIKSKIEVGSAPQDTLQDLHQPIAETSQDENTELEHMRQRIAALESQLNAPSTSENVNSEEVKQLRSDLAALGTQIKTRPHSDELRNLQNSISPQATDISRVSREIAALDSQLQAFSSSSDLKQLQDIVTTIQGNLKDLQTKLGGSASSEDLGKLQAAVTTLQTKLGGSASSER